MGKSRRDGLDIIARMDAKHQLTGKRGWGCNRDGRGVTTSTAISVVLCSLMALAAATSTRTIAFSQAQSAVVRVDSGDLQGVIEDGVESFKGIPFAAPPVGDLRWRPPQPPARRTGVRQATEFGANCMQGRFGPPAAAGAPAGPVPSEDCLYLNVWRPAAPASRNLPVMVWIHGGGFTGGSSSSPNTSGVGFAKQGVVLVAMNYRVGRFDFFAHPAARSFPRRQQQRRYRGQPDQGHNQGGVVRTLRQVERAGKGCLPLPSRRSRDFAQLLERAPRSARQRSVTRTNQIGSNSEHARCFAHTGMNIQAERGQLCGRKVLGVDPLSVRLNRSIGPEQT